MPTEPGAYQPHRQAEFIQNPGGPDQELQGRVDANAIAEAVLSRLNYEDGSK